MEQKMTLPPQIKSYTDSTFRKDFVFRTDPRLVVARDLARQMASKAFDGLDAFPFVYFTAGITEAIDFFCTKVVTQMLPGDYRYPSIYPTVTEEPADLLYFSYPFAGNGQFEKIPEGNKAVFLDCAYLFASNMTNARQLPDNVEYLAFSVSKSHNLADIRCGWVMTRKKIEAYHLMQYTYGYGSSAHVSVLQSVLSQVPNYLYLKYKDTFSAMYNANALREGDTNLFATKRSGERVPWYKLISNE